MRALRSIANPEVVIEMTGSGQFNPLDWEEVELDLVSRQTSPLGAEVLSSTDPAKPRRGRPPASKSPIEAPVSDLEAGIIDAIYADT